MKDFLILFFALIFLAILGELLDKKSTVLYDPVSSSTVIIYEDNNGSKSASVIKLPFIPTTQTKFSK